MKITITRIITIEGEDLPMSEQELAKAIDYAIERAISFPGRTDYLWSVAEPEQNSQTK